MDCVDHRSVDILERQRRQLLRTIEWAGRIRTTLQPVLEHHGDRVHFRPSSTGFSMVGLLPDWPQRGKSGLTNPERVALAFDRLFDTYCRNVEHGRVTGEKQLQSFLISEAQQTARRMASINAASSITDDPVELAFVTDEIPLPLEGGKTVCDILALRRDGGRSTPVLLELKDSRQMTRLVEQVTGYAALIDQHADLFAELYGAVLGEPVGFDGPTERWIVWPAAGDGPDPREQELRAKGIRVVANRQDDAGYCFDVGQAARGRDGLPGLDG